MTASGWYPDPVSSDGGTERWWDGTAWTESTREAPPTPAGTLAETTRTPPVADAPATTTGNAATGAATVAAQEPSASSPSRWTLVVALLAAAGLVAAALAIVVPRLGGTDEPIAAADDPTADADDPTADADETDDRGDRTEPIRPDDGPDDVASDAGRDEDASRQERLTERTRTLDGVCEVQLTAEDAADPSGVRPWNYAACTWAPIVLAPGEGEWIVVLASLNGAEHDADDALTRASQLGTPGRVLWSTHYPSLNPDLWVVFDGPYAGEEAAASAARDLGGGAYHRLLSDDADDRYCLAADGCIGERGSG